MAELKDLLGKTLVSVEENADKDRLTFETTKGKRYLMYHLQVCCESVSIEDICGELSDLIGSPILLAEEVSSSDKNDLIPSWASIPNTENTYEPDSHTWTFYRFQTAKGFVTIRWYGSSNGCYSESVTFTEEGSAY